METSLQKNAPPPTRAPLKKAAPVAFVHATPTNFLRKASAPRPGQSFHPAQESPVPSAWSKAKELAAGEASALPPGASLSALIGQRLANGLRPPLHPAPLARSGMGKHPALHP